MNVRSYYEKQVNDKLYEKYGPTPPIECVARVLQELKATRDNPFSRDLELIKILKDLGEREGIPIFMESFYGSSFIAWLLGASRINPLPPHRYCTHCHKIEFIYEAKDGWDLPTPFCCGEEMEVDGHNIPFDSIANSLPEKGLYLRFQISDDLLEKCLELVREFYQVTGEQIVPFHTEFTGPPEHDETALVLIPKADPIPPLDADGVWQVGEHDLYETGYKTIIFRSTPTLNEISSLSKQTEHRPDLAAKPSNNSLFHIYSELVEEYSHKDEIFLSEGDLVFSKFLKLFSFPHSTENWGSEDIAFFKEQGAHLEDLFTCREDIMNEILSHSNVYQGDGRSFAFQVMENTRKGIYAHSGLPAEIIRLLQSIGVPEYLIAQILKTQYLPLKGRMIEELLNRCILEDYRELVKLYPKEVA